MNTKGIDVFMYFYAVFSSLILFYEVLYSPYWMPKIVEVVIDGNHNMYVELAVFLEIIEKLQFFVQSLDILKDQMSELKWLINISEQSVDFGSVASPESEIIQRRIELIESQISEIQEKLRLTSIDYRFLEYKNSPGDYTFSIKMIKSDRTITI